MFTGVPVSDLAAGRTFFEGLFGHPPDIVPNDDEVMWRLTETAWLYLVVDPAHAGHAVATLSGGDLDSTLSELAERGVGCGPVEVVGTAGRKATLRDPDGNGVALVEVR